MWGHLGFLERGNLRKGGGGDLEKGWYDPPYQLCSLPSRSKYIF